MLPSPHERSRPAMSNIRREQRNPEKLQVLLSHMGDPFLTERASTENVSPHGLRVGTEYPWKRNAYLIVQSSANELWARARVAYCQALTRLLPLDWSLRLGQVTGSCAHRCESWATAH